MLSKLDAAPGESIWLPHPFDKFIEPIKSRKVETVAILLLEKLKQQQKEMDQEKLVKVINKLIK